MQRALQGVTHWIAHRRCLFRGYALSEGALVAEICNLVQANLPNDYLLRCEVPFAEFLPNAGKIADRVAKSSILTKRPDRFVDRKGGSRRIKRKLPSGGRYRVLRSYKALHSRSNVENAQYGCLVEVEARQD